MKYMIKGKLYDPIKVGDPSDWYHGDENCKCGDCGRKYGEKHDSGCDIERCPACGGQAISCDCGVTYEIPDNTSINKLERLFKQQKVENLTLELEVSAFIKDKVAYNSHEVFKLLAITKFLMIKDGIEHEFEDLRKKVVQAPTEQEALLVIKTYAENKIEKQKKKELEL